MTKKYEEQGLVDGPGFYKALGDYDNSLADVAKTGDYNDLTNKPLMFNEGVSGDVYINAADELGLTHLFETTTPFQAMPTTYFNFTGASDSEVYDFIDEVATRYGTTPNYLDDTRFNSNWQPSEGGGSFSQALSSDEYGSGIIRRKLVSHWVEVSGSPYEPVEGGDEKTIIETGYIRAVTISPNSSVGINMPPNTGTNVSVNYNGGPMIYDNSPIQTIDNKQYMLTGFTVDLEMLVTDSRIPSTTDNYTPVADTEYKLWSQLDHPEFSEVATSGSIHDLVDVDELSDVAFSGDYADLINAPEVSNDYDKLDNRPLMKVEHGTKPVYRVIPQSTVGGKNTGIALGTLNPLTDATDDDSNIHYGTSYAITSNVASITIGNSGLRVAAINDYSIVDQVFDNLHRHGDKIRYDINDATNDKAVFNLRYDHISDKMLRSGQLEGAALYMAFETVQGGKTFGFPVILEYFDVEWVNQIPHLKELKGYAPISGDKQSTLPGWLYDNATYGIPVTSFTVDGEFVGIDFNGMSFNEIVKLIYPEVEIPNNSDFYFAFLAAASSIYTQGTDGNETSYNPPSGNVVYNIWDNINRPAASNVFMAHHESAHLLTFGSTDSVQLVLRFNPDAFDFPTSVYHGDIGRIIPVIFIVTYAFENTSPGLSAGDELMHFFTGYNVESQVETYEFLDQQHVGSFITSVYQESITLEGNDFLRTDSFKLARVYQFVHKITKNSSGSSTEANVRFRVTAISPVDFTIEPYV